MLPMGRAMAARVYEAGRQGRDALRDASLLLRGAALRLIILMRATLGRGRLIIYACFMGFLALRGACARRVEDAPRDVPARHRRERRGDGPSPTQ